jgi:hypothetical protein
MSAALVTSASAALARREMRADQERLGFALVNSAKPWPGVVTLTIWEYGKFSTRGGTPKRRGKGVRWKGTLAEHAEEVRAYSTEIYAKGKGACVAHGESRYGGSCDIECVARTMLFVDCDRGEATVLLAALDFLKIGYVAQVRGLKFHIEIPLVTALPFPEDAAENRAAKARYRAELGWILGILAEAGQLATLDCATDRLLQLNYVYCRRTADDPPPVVLLGTGDRALDWDALLRHSGFTAPTLQPRSQRAEVQHATPSLLELAFGEVGMLGRSSTDGKFAVRCPFNAQHSEPAPEGAEPDTSTVLFPARTEKNIGTFHCSHAHCRGRNADDALDALPADVVARAVKKHDKTTAVARAHAELAATPQPRAIAASEAAERIAQVIRDAAATVPKIVAC